MKFLIGREPSTNPFVRFFRLVVGWTLVIVGIAGLFLPILQGVLMITLGLAVLSSESPFIRRQVRRFTPYYRYCRLRFNVWRAERRRKKQIPGDV